MWCFVSREYTPCTITWIEGRFTAWNKLWKSASAETSTTSQRLGGIALYDAILLHFNRCGSFSYLNSEKRSRCALPYATLRHAERRLAATFLAIKHYPSCRFKPIIESLYNQLAVCSLLAPYSATCQSYDLVCSRLH